MKLYQPIIVDLYNPYPLPKMNAQQHNVGRGVLVTLTANGQVIALSEETVRIFAKRPDENVSYLDCIITEDGKIQADFTDQMLAVKGSMEVELEFTTADTNITTPIFIVEVQESNVKDGVESSNEFKALEKYTTEASKYATSAGESANAAQEAMQKAQLIKDSIPEDYTELTEGVEEVYKATAILSTVQGTTPTTTDAANVPPADLKIFGKSTQKTYAGNQLLDANQLSKGTLTSLDISEDGYTITAVGGSTGTYCASYKELDSSQFAGKTVYFKVDSITRSQEVGHVHINIKDENGTNTFYVLSTTGYKTIDVQENTTLMALAINSNADTTLETDNTIVIKGLMLSFNNVDWEPYVGGQPSPNPEYTQEVQKHGEGGSIEQKLLTSQLLDANNPATVFNSTVEVNERELKLTTTRGGTGGAYDYVRYSVDVSELNGITELTLSVQSIEAIGTTNPRMYFRAIDADGNTILNLGLLQAGSVTMTIPENASEIRVVVYSNNGGTCEAGDGAIYTGLMLNLGSTALPWEPYTEQFLTLLTPNGLPGIPLGQTIPDSIANSPIHMSGVYHDGEQYWIGDTKELGRGKYVKRAYEETYDGSDDERWILIPNTKIGNRYYIYVGKGVKPSDTTNVVTTLNTNFPIGKAGATFDSTNVYTVTAKGELFISLNGTETLEELKTYLAEKPMTVQYILATPIETDLTTEEIEQFKALVMNYPNNTLLNDAGAYTELEYVCDTQEHIKQNYTPNSVTQDILERLSALEQNAVNNS